MEVPVHFCIIQSGKNVCPRVNGRLWFPQMANRMQLLPTVCPCPVPRTVVEAPCQKIRRGHRHCRCGLRPLPSACHIASCGNWEVTACYFQLATGNLQLATAASRASLLTISLEASLESLGSDLAAGNASSGFLLPHNNC